MGECVVPHKQKQNELPQASTIVNTKLDAQVKLIAGVRKRLNELNEQIQKQCRSVKIWWQMLIDKNKKVHELMIIAGKPKVSKLEFITLNDELSGLDNFAREIQDRFVAMKKNRSATDDDFSLLAKELKLIKSALKRVHCKSSEDDDLFETACNDYNTLIDRLAAQRFALLRVSQNFNETEDKSFGSQVRDCVNRINIAKEMISEMEPVKAAGKKYGLPEGSFLSAPAKDVAAETVAEDKKRSCTIL